MIKITNIKEITEYIIIQNEIYIRLMDLINILGLDYNNKIEINNCIIVPYYIKDNKRMELYQFEFFISDEYDFDEFIIKKTGKEIKDIPQQIYNLRKKCFAKTNEKNKLIEYLYYLRNNSEIINAIKKVFYVFDEKNLYVEIY